MKYVHVALNVTDLEKAVHFYTRLFGAEPVKVKPDYAKFLLESPGLNLTLNQASDVSGNQINHFGFQVSSTEEVLAHKDRLSKLGLLAERDEFNTTCCYAVQDKFWVHDPDGNEWEFFYTKADADVHREETGVCCTPDGKRPDPAAGTNADACCLDGKRPDPAAGTNADACCIR